MKYMTGAGMAVRAGLVLLMSGFGLGLWPFMDLWQPLLPAGLYERWQQVAGHTCTSTCRCSYCDQIINGRCYTRNREGYRNCTASCGTRKCNFRPHADGCGAILYLGCTDGDCQGVPTVQPAPTRHPEVIIPPPRPTSTGVPPATPGPGCEEPLEWVELQPPVIDTILHQPPHPVLQSQIFEAGFDADVDFFLTVQGGKARKYARKEVRECPGGGTYPDDCPGRGRTRCKTVLKAAYRDPVTEVQMDLILTEEAQVWISRLSPRYLQAHVRQAAHSAGIWRGSTMSDTVVLPDWQPRDPGTYEGTATVTTQGTPISDPQTVQQVHRIAVSLRNTTLAP